MLACDTHATLPAVLISQAHAVPCPVQNMGDGVQEPVCLSARSKSFFRCAYSHTCSLTCVLLESRLQDRINQGCASMGNIRMLMEREEVLGVRGLDGLHSAPGLVSVIPHLMHR